LTRVPRYFFHVHDSVDIIDQEGTEFPGLQEARGEAVVTAGEMLRDVGGRFWNSGEWRIWVTDEAGQTVCALKFSSDQARI
jgi:hypothetical protein